MSESDRSTEVFHSTLPGTGHHDIITRVIYCRCDYGLFKEILGAADGNHMFGMETSSRLHFPLQVSQQAGVADLRE